MQIYALDSKILERCNLFIQICHISRMQAKFHQYSSTFDDHLTNNWNFLLLVVLHGTSIVVVSKQDFVVVIMPTALEGERPKL